MFGRNGRDVAFPHNERAGELVLLWNDRLYAVGVIL